MKAAFALARSATKLAPLRPSDPTIGMAKGTPASGNVPAFATATSTFLTGSGVAATALLVAPEEAAAAELADELPALEEAAADALPDVAAAADEVLEELELPLEAPDDPLEAAAPGLTAATELPVELEELAPEGVEVFDFFNVLDELALEPPPEALAALFSLTATTEEVVDELVDAADATAVESKTTASEIRILFIEFLKIIFRLRSTKRILFILITYILGRFISTRLQLFYKV